MISKMCYFFILREFDRVQQKKKKTKHILRVFPSQDNSLTHEKWEKESYFFETKSMCIKRGKKKECTAGKSVGSVRQVTQTLSREWMVRSTDERATVLLTGYRRETGGFYCVKTWLCLSTTINLICYRDYSIQKGWKKKTEKEVHREERERVPDGTSFKSRVALSNNLFSVFLFSFFSHENSKIKDRKIENPPSSEEWMTLLFVQRLTQHPSSPKSTITEILLASIIY